MSQEQVTPSPIASAMQWQQAYLAGDARLLDLHAGPAWDWSAPWAARNHAEPAPLTLDELAEWRTWLGTAADTPAAGRLDALTRPGARVVVTGQQAGAALGPLYCLYKAFAAIRWAQEIERETGSPCLPIFWIASDDHDLAEVEHASWLTRDGRIETAKLSSDNAAATAPVYNSRLDNDRMESFLARLAESTVPSEFQPGLLEDLKTAMSDGDFESQFLELLRRWLVPLGLIPVAPRLGFIRRRAASLFRKEIESFEATNRAVLGVSEKIAALGMKPPIHRSGNEVNFFLEIDGIRGKVVGRDGSFDILEPGTSAPLAVYTKGELTALLESAPERFSPNAILRPLIQDAVFPNAAYIPGPTELVYHTQLAPLYEQFAVNRPALLPRPNVILLETKTSKALGKLGLTETEAAVASVSELDSHLDAARLPSSELDAITSRLEELKARMDNIQSAVFDFTMDTGSRKAAEKLKNSMITGIGKLSERLASHVATLDSDRVRAREKLIENLFPGGSPQERTIGPLAPLLMQHGTGVLEVLMNEIDYKANGFQTIHLAAITEK